MNSVVIAVFIMLVLSLARVHVVLSLLIGALSGGLLAGMGLTATLDAFQTGLANGAQIALSYVMLGAFAMAIAYSGLPRTIANGIIKQLDGAHGNTNRIKWALIGILIIMGIMSQNVIPIHIAFIPLIIPPLIVVFNRLHIDRRAIACVLTFGLVTTYMYLPYGFGEIFLKQILLGNINKAGLDTSELNIMTVMTIPSIGMLAGLIIALFISYRKPRFYENKAITSEDNSENESENGNNGKSQRYNNIIAIIAVVGSFAIQLSTGSLLLGAMIGFTIFMAFGVIHWRKADAVFNDGLRMMAMIGFIMISAQGFAEVIQQTGDIDSLVQTSAEIFAGSKGLAAMAMLLVGLLVTMGIGSSFSTLPIISSIYVPICIAMGFSPAATVALIGAAGALGDAGSPASDSTLGPTMGLNVDGQHNHIYDSVLPTFIHFNIPLLIFGWIAAMVL
ncbi:MAG: sodium:proton antiporter [Alcaligenaceae bacterium]|jgi:predicted histidine transporter YuiF (NhaC family)|nr:sodium:proton antiporter [Alcaligenaceae bacterium]